MKTKLVWSAVITLVMSWGAAGAEKPRVFITESQALQLSGRAAAGDAKGSLLMTGGTSPQSVEVMKSFTQLCPGVVVTASREKADYVVRLDHEDSNPTTLFVKGNKVAVFNKDQDLVYSGSTRLLGNAVKGACAAITGH
jgi:hypothetical protein